MCMSIMPVHCQCCMSMSMLLHGPWTMDTDTEMDTDKDTSKDTDIDTDMDMVMDMNMDADMNMDIGNFSNRLL